MALVTEAYRCRPTPAGLILRNDLRKQYRDQIVLAKRAACDKYIADHHRAPAAIWRIIGGVRGSVGAYAPSSVSAEGMNDFFVTAPATLAHSTGSSTDPINSFKFPPTLSSDQFKFTEVSQIRIRDAIRAINNGKSCDYYGLNAVMIKKVTDLVTAPLTKLFNSCIRMSIYPNAFKIACVTPIYKKGDTDDPSNYRPVSILPVLSKIFEYIFKQQLSEHLNLGNILSHVQHGFRAGRSTSTALTEFVGHVVDSFENGHYCSVSLLDLTKAFDCVPHDLLIRKLNHYSFSPGACAILKSYLCDRWQCVRHNGDTSSTKQLLTGVPQESILGPIWFLIYFNDLPANLDDGHALLYADDTTLFSDGAVLAEVERCHERLLSAAEEWFSANKLTLNLDKTENLLFTLRDGQSDREHCKFLGVHIDVGLTWHRHGDVLSGRLCSAVFAMRRLSESVSARVLRISYFALFHAHLSYGVLSWGHSSIVTRIFGIQRRAIRVLAGLGYRDDCRAAFSSLKILTLPSLYIYECLKYIITNLHLMQRHNDVHAHSTRHNNNLRQTHLRLSRSRTGTNYYGIKFYNVIDKNLTALPRKQFLSCIKSYLLEKSFFGTDEFLNDPPK